MKIELINEKFDPWEKLVDYKKNQLQNSSKIGATSIFLGTMRDYNDDGEVVSMDLEHYPNMTEKYLKKIAEDVLKKFEIIDCLILHRIGFIQPTDFIVLIATWSEHRNAAFNATRDIMESLKSEAPFWKKESSDHGFKWVESKEQLTEESTNES